MMNDFQNDKDLGEFLRKNKLDCGQASNNLENIILEKTVRATFAFRFRKFLKDGMNFRSAVVVVGAFSAALVGGLWLSQYAAVPISSSVPEVAAIATRFAEPISDEEVLDFMSETVNGATQSEGLLTIYPSQHFETL